jgi:hypothetical protein
MRIFHVAGLVAATVVTLAANARPSAAVIIYPWCANFGGAAGRSDERTADLALDTADTGLHGYNKLKSAR